MVEQAKGILMARHGIGAVAAESRLRTAARYAHRPVEQIATDLICDLLRRGRHTPPHPAPGERNGRGGPRPLSAA